MIEKGDWVEGELLGQGLGCYGPYGEVRSVIPTQQSIDTEICVKKIMVYRTLHNPCNTEKAELTCLRLLHTANLHIKSLLNLLQRSSCSSWYI